MFKDALLPFGDVGLNLVLSPLAPSNPKLQEQMKLKRSYFEKYETLSILILLEKG